MLHIPSGASDSLRMCVWVDVRTWLSYVSIEGIANERQLVSLSVQRTPVFLSLAPLSLLQLVGELLCVVYLSAGCLIQRQINKY